VGWKHQARFDLGSCGDRRQAARHRDEGRHALVSGRASAPGVHEPVQRDELAKRSRTELPPSKDTVAVVIPIRKSAAWWALAQDERAAYFQKREDQKGHTAIGAEYVERFYRKLYHTRYAVETTDHDFITYFEFQREHEGDF